MKINIIGRLDESTHLPSFKLPLAGRLDLDLEDLGMMNSIGCRNWTIWIKGIQASQGIFLHNCPPQFVAHVSILTGFLPANVTVESFYIPYYCENCGATQRIRAERGKDFSDTIQFNVRDQIICPICSSIMCLDTMKDNYLRFLTKRPA